MRSRGALLERFHEKAATGDLTDAVRRHAAMRIDQAWVLAGHHLARLGRRPSPAVFDGSVRIALVTVNAVTTRWLKLMLLTLGEQSDLSLIGRIVIVDNGSDESELTFLSRLEARVPRIELVERRHFLTHAHGLRAGVRRVQRVDEASRSDPCNVYLFCDPDVIFRSPDALTALAGTIVREDAALTGEWRGPADDPDIQASFLAVRRDAYDHPDVVPPVHHGSPTLWMQRSIARAGHWHVGRFPSNHGGYVLHRGRSAALNATRRPVRAHFMGVPDGDAIWAEIESRYTEFLEPRAEPELLDRITARLAGHRAPPDESIGVPVHAATEPLEPNTAVEWSPGVLQRQTLGGVLVMGPPGELLQLCGSGSVLWPLFEHATTPAEVSATVTAVFGVDLAVATEEVDSFVGSLLASGALRRVDSSHA